MDLPLNITNAPLVLGNAGLRRAKDMSSLLPIEYIERQIYLIRGQRVMLDSHLARLYEVKAIHLRQQVKRNRDDFPEDFMFQLTEEEAAVLVSQSALCLKATQWRRYHKL